MYINSLFKFSLLIEARSSISLLLMYIQRSPEFTRLRLSRQNGQDSDLPCLNRKEKKNQQLWPQYDRFRGLCNDRTHNTIGLPVSVAFHTHWVIATGQNNHGVDLHATNITLFFIFFCINFGALSFVYQFFTLVLSSTEMFLFPIINISDSLMKLQ